MRIGNIAGRAKVIVDEAHAVDIETASGGRFGSDPGELYDRWEQFRGWTPPADAPVERFTGGDIGNPAPAPRQIFAIGLNYRDHAAESDMAVPAEPAVFTKFASSLAGPFTQVALPVGHVDWEVELVVVIGRGGRHIPATDAWRHVAGVAVGQDLSERRLQAIGPVPQFSLAKSHHGFGPIGPFLVTTDELPDPDDLVLGCSLNGEQVQKSRTSHMIFPVPELIARLSAVTELWPGDVIFTGTPSGVGAGRTPQRFLAPGDELVSSIDGVGEIRQTFVAVA
ncbi:fumarylacetoacetate hydrolase family protein [Actinoallomurus sp. NPDC052274]|uniref:fumarylacetoacetate hydrolase family protein n=1 Tax=Actinoallomurus sp. NPDC052274 TaxID=3155420 RepID=UPI003420B6FD